MRRSSFIVMWSVLAFVLSFPLFGGVAALVVFIATSGHAASQPMPAWLLTVMPAFAIIIASTIGYLGGCGLLPGTKKETHELAKLDEKPPYPIGNVQQTNPRPVAITIACILGFIGTFLSIPMIFSPGVRKVGAWYPPFIAFGTLIGFFCFLGLWKMRKRALFTYTGLIAVNQIIMLTMGHWSVVTLGVPGIILLTGFIYLSKMK